MNFDPDDVLQAWSVLSVLLERRIDNRRPTEFKSKYRPIFDEAVKIASLELWNVQEAAQKFRCVDNGRRIEELDVVRNAIIVAYVSEDHYEVLDGNHRLITAFENKLKTIPVLVIKLPWAGALGKTKASTLI